MNTHPDYCPAGENDGEHAPFVPLNQVKAGMRVRIKALTAAPELTCRLRELGLCEGQTIRLIACHSNIICLVCNARLALTAALAQLILVEAVAA